MINFANEKNKSTNPKNLEFVREDINSYKNLTNYEIDFATSTLCLHEMKEIDAIKTLKSLSKVSSNVLIADYSKPKSFWAKVLIELDEMISGHYGRFKEYRNNGYLPYLASKAGLVVREIKETPIDGILIWELKREIHV